MPVIAKEPESSGSSSDFKPISSGSHVARCISVVDLGTQLVPVFGKQDETAEAHQVALIFELFDEQYTDKEGADHNLTISQTYKLSLHEKAKLRKELKKWRGQDFTGGELAGFDLERLINAPCLVSVSHSKPNKDGRIFANIEGLSAMIKGVQTPEATREKFAYSIEDGAGGNFTKLPPFMQKKALKSKELLAKPEEQARAKAYEEAVTAGPARNEPIDAEYSDIPDSDLPF